MKFQIPRYKGFKVGIFRISKNYVYTPVNPIFYTPAYEVYRGYIVFAFSVYMFECVLVCLLTFFLSKISRKLFDLGF